MSLRISSAREADTGIILDFIRQLADYEKLSHEVAATEETLRATLFGERPYAEVLIAYWEKAPMGFALFFHNYSTFLAKPGIYLEDLFVNPAARGKGIGKALLTRLAEVALERGCGRVDWAVLDWNAPSIEFYRRMGAMPMNEWTTFRLTGEALDAYGK